MPKASVKSLPKEKKPSKKASVKKSAMTKTVNSKVGGKKIVLRKAQPPKKGSVSERLYKSLGFDKNENFGWLIDETGRPYSQPLDSKYIADETEKAR
jgi:hypothetical protein